MLCVCVYLFQTEGERGRCLDWTVAWGLASGVPRSKPCACVARSAAGALAGVGVRLDRRLHWVSCRGEGY